MITVSDKAKEKVARLIRDAHLDDSYRLRASVAGGGCSGLSYTLYLAGTELDFSDGLNGKGFQFNNPNASRECGCGESFSV